MLLDCFSFVKDKNSLQEYYIMSWKIMNDSTAKVSSDHEKWIKAEINCLCTKHH